MRVITGKYKGRKLYTLEGLNTRPMMDRMKESIFNIIGPYFSDEVVLDLFGGSGALTIESLSRGAKEGVIVEKSSEAIKIINKNIELVKEENIKVINKSYEIALDDFKKQEKKFDIVFLDPPFRLLIIEDIINYLTTNNLLNDNAYIIGQYLKGNYTPNETNSLEIVKHYSYAVGEVIIYQYKN